MKMRKQTKIPHGVKIVEKRGKIRKIGLYPNWRGKICLKIQKNPLKFQKNVTSVINTPV